MDELLKQQCISNIANVYAQATDSEIEAGKDWYKTAKSIACLYGKHYDISSIKVIAIIAALSPMIRWTINLQNTETFLHIMNQDAPETVESLREIAKAKHDYIFAQYNQALSKAIKIYFHESDHIPDLLDIVASKRGIKTRSFCLNMLFPCTTITDKAYKRSNLSVVTVDRHIFSLVMGKMVVNDYFPTNGHYRNVQACIIECAQELDILPQQLQAIIWIVWRRLKDIIDD